jgi:hypothetical protein
VPKFSPVRSCTHFVTTGLYLLNVTMPGVGTVHSSNETLTLVGATVPVLLALSGAWS